MGIDQIFEMLSWNNDEKVQVQGIEEAKKIRNLSVFILPIESKSIWENCAKVLASKTDQELELYLVSMFEWLKDMNWPGADIIYDRLKQIPIQHIEDTYSLCSSIAERTNDSVWKEVLTYFYNDL